MSETVRSLRSLQDYLARDFPGCLLMPTAPGGKGKAPRLPHKPKANGEELYTLADAYDRGIPLCTYGCLILLASDLIVVDVDDEDLAKTMLNQVDFKNTACARTKKGYHFYFRRTPRCDEVGLFNGARQMAFDDGADIPIDIMTVWANGTRGCISIAPSPDKVWVRKLGEFDPLPMPDLFIDTFLDFSKSMNSSSRGQQSSTPRAPSFLPINIHFIQDLVNILNPRRAFSYPTWIAVGWCLHAVSASTLFPVWDAFSKQCSKYTPGECDLRWYCMRNSGRNLGVGSLCMWAKEDDPAAFAAVQEKHRVPPDAKRQFYASLKTSEASNASTASAFLKVINYIVGNVLHYSDVSIAHTIILQSSDQVCLRFNFGFICYEDMMFFKRIVRFFCTFKTSVLTARQFQLVSGFDDSIYKCKVPAVDPSDEASIAFYLAGRDKKHDLKSACDRYIIKTISNKFPPTPETESESDKLPKSKVLKKSIHSHLHRDIIEDIAPYDRKLIKPEHGDNFVKFLSCIPSQVQTHRAWKIVGMCIKHEKQDKALWADWDPNRAALADSLWYSLDPGASYNTKLLLFIASIYVERCKTSYEHTRMVCDLYEKPHGFSIDDIGQRETYNEGVIDPILGRCKPFDLVNYDVYSSIAPLGSGKTHCSIEAIKPILMRNPSTTVLVPTSRQTYADNITGRYSGPDGFDTEFLCYKATKSNLKITNHPGLVVQLESIMRTNRDTYDIVIGDEFESLLAQLSSTTMLHAGFERCLLRILHYLCNASKIVLMDAFGSNRMLCTIAFIIQNHVNRNIRCMHSVNKAKTITRTAFNVGTITGTNKDSVLNDLMQHMVRKIKQGRKIVFVSGNRKYLESIVASLKAKFKDLRVKSYTAAADDTVCQTELRNCESAWLDCDVVCWTSKVLIGVNFSIPNVFDSIFVIGDNRTCLVRDMHQSIMRVRHIISDELYFVTTELDCPERRDKIGKNFQDFASDITHHLKYVKFTDKRLPQYENFIIYLLAYNDYEKYNSRRCYTVEFKRLLQEQNYTLKDAPAIAQDDSVVFQSICEADSDNNYQRITDLIRKEAIDASTAEERVRDSKATEMDKVVDKVASFNTYYRSRVPDDTLVDTEWQNLFKVYSSPDESFLENAKSECSATIHGIAHILEYNRSSLFGSINARKLDYILKFNADIGYTFSLDDKNFQCIISQDLLAQMYDKYAQELDSISKLFKVRCAVHFDGSMRSKAKLLASYLNGAYSHWVGLSFKTVDSVQKRYQNERERVFRYALCKPERSSCAFAKSVLDGTVSKFLAAIMSARNSEGSYSFRD